MKQQNILPILFLWALLPACKAVVKTGYEHNKKNIGIIVLQHNTSYQVEKNYLLGQNTEKKLDAFDAHLIYTLERRIDSAGYLRNKPGSMQNTYLKDCLLDIKQAEPISIYREEDKFEIPRLDFLLACSQFPDSSKIFYTQMTRAYPYAILPLSLCHDSLSVQTGKSYCLSVASPDIHDMKLWAGDMAQNAIEKLDEENKIAFKKNFPEEWNKVYKKSGARVFLETAAGVAIIVALISLFYIIPSE